MMEISLADAKRMAQEMRWRALDENGRPRFCRPIPRRLKAALMNSCVHHLDAPIEFTPWRWHTIARNLGLASVQ